MIARGADRHWPAVLCEALVEMLLARGLDTDIDNAQNAVDRLSAMRVEPGHVVIRDLTTATARPARARTRRRSWVSDYHRYRYRIEGRRGGLRRSYRQGRGDGELPWLSSRRARRLYRERSPQAWRATATSRASSSRAGGTPATTSPHTPTPSRTCCATRVSPTVRPVGLVVRNRLQHAAAIIGFLAAGRPLSMIYSFQSPESIGRDIEKLELSAIVADREDWTAPVIDAAKRAGSAGVAISLTSPTVAAVEGLGASRRIAHACRGRTRCGPADSDQRHHWAAEAAGDQDTCAGTNGVQRDQR